MSRRRHPGAWPRCRHDGRPDRPVMGSLARELPGNGSAIAWLVVAGVPLLAVGGCILGVYVLHRVIRSAISEGMKDYALWKIQLDAELGEQE